MQQLIQLRWIAVVGQIATILVVHFGFGIHLPLDQMLAVLACLAAFNAASQLRWRIHRDVTNTELFVALLVDVAMLTAQLYLSGGATNPFVFLYLLQVILGAVLLEPWSTLDDGRHHDGLLRRTGAVLSAARAAAVDHGQGLFSPYVLGMLVCFALIAALLVVFITRISRNLRGRDARLADLRQRAAEEEHIVRMGLLASGAAHELGTPLATLAVILGDWRRTAALHLRPRTARRGQRDAGPGPALQDDPDRHPAVGRRGARRESSVETTVSTFLDDLVEEWRDHARRARPSLTRTGSATTCPWSRIRR